VGSNGIYTPHFRKRGFSPSIQQQTALRFNTVQHCFLIQPDTRSKTQKEMPERRHQATTSSSSNRSTNNVRRNLFHQHLSRRPTTSSTSTSAETLRLDVDPESDSSDIVIRDKNGEFEIGDPPMQSFDEQEEGGNGDAQEDESMSTLERAWDRMLI
jgi:hypothetical protein